MVTDVSCYSQCFRVHGYLHVTVTLLCRECECCDLQTACMLWHNWLLTGMYFV